MASPRKRLGPWLAFAVIYADAGSSIYYAPGILWLTLGHAAPLILLATTAIFVFVARKYAEVAARCTDGGGVVSIAHLAFPRLPLLPLVGGGVATVDYFLTSAISGVSAIYYLRAFAGFSESLVVPLALALLGLLIFLNVVGVKESAAAASGLALAQIIVSALLAGLALWRVGAQGAWGELWRGIAHPGLEALPPALLLVGYADSWLAYSGLESGAQLAAVMELPVKETASRAMWRVILALAPLSPLLTAISLALVPNAVKTAQPQSLVAQLAGTLGGAPLKALAVASAVLLLAMACNTALVGNYQVNLRLVSAGFLPPALGKRNRRFGTPLLSVIISGLVPMLVVYFSSGNVRILGDLYAFGLLGTLFLSSLSIDVLRAREGAARRKLAGGWLTTLALGAAWLINAAYKPHALAFGGGMAVLLLLSSLAYRRGWLAKIWPAAAPGPRPEALTSEQLEHLAGAAPEAARVLTLREALALRPLERASVLVALRGPNPRLLEDAAMVAKGLGESSVYLIMVDEAPGLFFQPIAGPSEEANAVLAESVRDLEQQHRITGIPIWRISNDAAGAIADAVERLEVQAVMVGTSKRSAIWHLLRGHVVKVLGETLPERARLLICN